MLKIYSEMLSEAKEKIKFYRDFKFKPFRLSEYGTEKNNCNEVIPVDELIKTDSWKNIAANELLNLYEKYKINNQVEVALSAIAIGPVLLLTVPAELFVEYGIEIKNRLKDIFKVILIFVLSNGWIGYIPTKKAFSFKEGAYEVQFLNSSKLIERAGDIIVEELTKMSLELKRLSIVDNWWLKKR